MSGIGGIGAALWGLQRAIRYKGYKGLPLGPVQLVERPLMDVHDASTYKHWTQAPGPCVHFVD